MAADFPAHPEDPGGAITEARGAGIPEDGTIVAGFGNGTNPRHNTGARVAKNVMEIDCEDHSGNGGDGFTDCANQRPLE